MAALLSFGQNGRWRRFLVARIPPGSHVLDVASGTAGVAISLVRRRGARVIGLDQNLPMLLRGKAAVRAAGASQQISLVLGKGERLPFADESFDALTFTYLLRYVDDPAATLRELARVVRPGGKIACVEFAVPRNPLWRAGWWAYTRLVLPLIGRAISRAWYRVGRFLGGSVSDFYRRYPLSEQIRMWRAAGLRYVGFRRMSLGVGIVIWAVKDG